MRAALSLTGIAVLWGCVPQMPAAPRTGIADLLLDGGAVYTMDADRPFAESIAVCGTKICYVGGQSEARSWVGPNTQVIELGGRFVMPGLFDAHVHPVLGGTEVLLQCLFSPSASPDDIRRVLTACVQDNPDSPWIVGGRWDSNFFENHEIDSPRAWLDEISAEKAISLADDTGHNRWVNSRALALAGIGRDFHVAGGEALRDEQGEPNGLLLETAMMPVLEAIPKWTAAQTLRAARESIRTANGFGITGIKEAGDANEGVVAYKALEQAGELTVHLDAAIAIPLRSNSLEIDFQKLTALRETNRGHNLDTDHVKIFIDGVPSVARTAAMLEDYLPDAPEAEAHPGKLLVPPDVLTRWIQQLDALGITVTAHTAGDRAVRVTLDAIENARNENGNSRLRHQLAHSGFIHPDDMPRFADLGAVADMSPAIWYPSPITDSIIAALGERGKRYWPVSTLLKSGALVIAGSDWPAVVPDMNPWPGIEALVTRRNPFDNAPAALWPEQAVTLKQALSIYVTNGARLLGVESKTASIEVGKLADLIVLDRHLFEIPIEDVSETRVELTLFSGEIVHRRPDR